MYIIYEKVLESFAQRAVAIVSINKVLKKDTGLFGLKQAGISFEQHYIEKNTTAGNQNMQVREQNMHLSLVTKGNQINVNTVVQRAKNAYMIGQMLTTNIQEILMITSDYVGHVTENMMLKIMGIKEGGVKYELCQN